MVSQLKTSGRLRLAVKRITFRIETIWLPEALQELEWLASLGGNPTDRKSCLTVIWTNFAIEALVDVD